MGFPNDDELIEIGTSVHNVFGGARSLCKYGMGWKDGHIHNSQVTWCHAGLMTMNKDAKLTPGPVVITNKVMYGYGNGLSKENIDRYTSFLMNDSVFSECIVNKDVSKVGKQGIIVRTDKPPNLVAATCIATRQAWEHPWVMDTTLKLVDAGVPPRIAEIVSYMASISSSGLLTRSYTQGHSPMRLSTATRQTIRSILNCDLSTEVECNKSTYQKVLTYSGIPDMWRRVSGGRKFSPDFNSGVLYPTQKDPFGLLKRVEKKKELSNAELVMEIFKEFL